MLNKMKRANFLLYAVDILCFLLLLAVQLRLTDGFHMPDQADLLSFLISSRMVLLAAFVILVVITIVLCWIANDIRDEIAFLYERIRELEKNIEKED